MVDPMKKPIDCDDSSRDLGKNPILLLIEEILHQLIWSISHYLPWVLYIPGLAGVLSSTVSNLDSIQVHLHTPMYSSLWLSEKIQRFLNEYTFSILEIHPKSSNFRVHRVHSVHPSIFFGTSTTFKPSN